MLIYDRLKEVCKEKGTSAASVEKQAGLGNGAVTKWNDFSPTVKNLKAVADVLGVPIEYFLE